MTLLCSTITDNKPQESMKQNPGHSWHFVLTVTLSKEAEGSKPALWLPLVHTWFGYSHSSH